MSIEKQEKLNTKRKTWTGVVVSDKADKTITVEVKSVKVHPVYKKRMKRTKKYKVHDHENKYTIGDKVKFVETRPISKDKRWKTI